MVKQAASRYIPKLFSVYAQSDFMDCISFFWGKEKWDVMMGPLPPLEWVCVEGGGVVVATGFFLLLNMSLLMYTSGLIALVAC